MLQNTLPSDEESQQNVGDYLLLDKHDGQLTDAESQHEESDNCIGEESCTTTVNYCDNDNDSNSFEPDISNPTSLYDMSVFDSNKLSTTPLYVGSKCTLLDALVKYFYWFSNHPGISKEALSNMLSLQHDILPEGNNLPSSYNAAIKLVEPLLQQPVVFHACRNDCIIFRNDYAKYNTCPKCGESRYAKTGSAAKRFLYLPVGPRLVRLFGTSNLSQIVQAHGLHISGHGLSMYDVHDSPAWKFAYSNLGQFSSDFRGISFAFNTDGVNPFSHNKVSYSMWPMILTILNLPRNNRHLFGNVWLVATIPGNGNKEPNTLDPYLDVMVDELLEISNQKLFDSYKNAPFNLKVDILFYVLDYPGISKVFSTMGSNSYQGCAWCEVEGI